MNISVDTFKMTSNEQLELFDELMGNMTREDLIEGLGTSTISDIVNDLQPFELDSVVDGFDSFVVTTIKDKYLNEKDCAEFINESFPEEIQNFVNNLTDDTCEELFKLLDSKINPNN